MIFVSKRSSRTAIRYTPVLFVKKTSRQYANSFSLEVLGYSNFRIGFAKVAQMALQTSAGSSSPNLSSCWFLVFEGYTRPSEVDPELMCPVLDVFCCCLPRSWKRSIRYYISREKVSCSFSLGVHFFPQKSWRLFGRRVQDTGW